MKRFIILFAVIILGSLPIYAQTNRTGTILFAAFTDTNQDSGIFPETDASSLFSRDFASGTITRLGSRPILPVLPTFSPDRSRLAFIDGANQVAVGALNTPATILSPVGVTSLAWLPDGNRLVYRAGSERESLFLTYTNGSSQLQITAPNLERDLIQLAPDGRRILFTQTVVDSNQSGAIGLPGDTNRLYYADLTTGEIRALTDGSFRVESPRWSPDGSRIAFVQITDSNFDAQFTEVDARSLWLMDSNGNIIRRLSPEGSVGVEGVVWNATGTHILFVHQPDLDLNGIRSITDPYQIGSVEASIGSFHVLAQAVEITQLVTSPDGLWFAFTATIDDTNGDTLIDSQDAESLFVAGINQASPTRLNPPGSLATGALAFTPRQLAYVAALHDSDANGFLTREDATALFVVDLTPNLTPSTEPVAAFNRLGQIAWSPGEDSLIVSVDTDQRFGVLGLVEVASGAFSELSDSSLRLDLTYPLLWLP